MLSLKEAHEQGSQRGYNAATWVFDGNTDASYYAKVLQMFEDGDPEVYDLEPAWLSGEWAGESIPELFDLETGEEVDEMVLETYETSASEAFWSEVQRVARLQVSS